MRYYVLVDDDVLQKIMVTFASAKQNRARYIEAAVTIKMKLKLGEFRVEQTGRLDNQLMKSWLLAVIRNSK